MKRILHHLFILGLTVSAINGYSQNYFYADSVIDTYPKSFRSPEKLAQQILFDFKSDSLKARAIYAWVAKNISYDVIALFKKRKRKFFGSNRMTIDQYSNKIALKTIRKKKGVCSGYAHLFKQLCNLSGIPCNVISGDGKNRPYRIGKKPISQHAWNTVNINGEWHLVDATWGAGNVSGSTFYPDFHDTYFFTNPSRFVLNHYPKDTTWSLIATSKADYQKMPLFYSPYLRSKLDIVYPNEGIINLAKNDIFVIRIYGEKESKDYSYSYLKDKYFGKIYPTFLDSNQIELLIPDLPPRNGYLTIYRNSEALVTFKVQFNY